MSRRSSRTLLVFGLVAAVAGAALLLLRILPGAAGVPDAARATDAGPPREPVDPLVRAEAPRLAGRGPAPPAPVAQPAATAPASADPFPDAPGVAAWIDVTVEAPTDWPEVNGYCYALPAGAPGVDNADDVAHAWVDAAATSSPTVRLPVPRAGRWDVGFVGAWGHALAEDVRVEAGATATARITFPGYAPLHVRVPSDLLPPPADHVLLVQARGEGGVVERGVPGRGERAPSGVRVSLEPGAALVTTPSVSPNVPWRVRVSAVRRAGAPPAPPAPPTRSLRPPVRYTAVPDVVRAGETVDLVGVPAAAIELRLAYEGTFSPAWRGNGSWMHFHVEADGGWAVGGGVTIGPEKDPPYPDRVVVYADPGLVRISWRAHGVLAGELAPFTVARGETLHRDVLVRLDPDYDPRAVGEVHEEPGIRLRVTGVPDGDEPAELRLFGWRRNDEGRLEIRDAGWGGDDDDILLDPSWRRVPWVLAVYGSTHASRPTPAPRGAELEVSLEPAGFVLVAPTALLPASLGRVRIRRQDGHPLPHAFVEDGDLRVGVIDGDATGEPGRLLGPLPGGAYVFEVLVGGVHSEDVRVTVAPGRVAVLRYGP